MKPTIWREFGLCMTTVGLVLSCGCASAPKSEGTQRAAMLCEPAPANWEANLELVRHRAAAWLQIVEMGQSSSSAPRLAILSYPEGAPELARRSFIYDAALAVLYFSWIDEVERAEGLVNTLIALQGRDGAWGFSFDVDRDGFYDVGYTRAGSIAWVAHALAYFGQRFEHKEAVFAARKAARHLVRQRVNDANAAHHGLVRAGRGSHDPSSGRRKLVVPVDFAVTEHQFDVHMALANAYPRAAELLAASVIERLWLDGAGRFAVGAGPQGLDEQRALDASGGWGALWLWSIGERERARRSLAYTLEHFTAQTERIGGYVPYLDPIDGHSPQSARDLIFVEGSLGVGLAALRLGERAVARGALEMAVHLSCASGPGIPYANRDVAMFPAIPAGASTLWFLFLEREYSTGKRAPLFESLWVEPIEES
ncbi:MAG: hypothetical protein H0U74_05235 [Bradymonadaceae bacterium]|nr:hypothetical protein [Lujinxingiaceae bacterium]